MGILASKFKYPQYFFVNSDWLGQGRREVLCAYGNIISPQTAEEFLLNLDRLDSTSILVYVINFLLGPIFRLDFNYVSRYANFNKQIAIALDTGELAQMTAKKVPTRKEVLDMLPEFLDRGGDKIRAKTLIMFEENTVQDILEIPNAEIRQMMILTYKNGLSDFLKDGAGKIVKSGELEEDEVSKYKYADILEMEISNEKQYFLKLINRTIDANASKMTAAERMKAGLTADGFKIYIIGLTGTPDDYDCIADAVGASWCYGPGEYVPDVEA